MNAAASEHDAEDASAIVALRGCYMSDLLKFESDHGGAVLIEVTDSSGGPVTRGYRPAAAVAQASASLEQVFGQVGPVVRGMVAELRAGANWPGEVEIEFAVKISADSNVIIAKAGGEANFRICMRWSQEAGS